jgi:hypothetical protein
MRVIDSEMAICDGNGLAIINLRRTANLVGTSTRKVAAAEVFEGGGNGRPSAPQVDIKTLHAKIGELALENDFLELALSKAGLPSAKR